MKLSELLGEGQQLQEGAILPTLEPTPTRPRHSTGWSVQAVGKRGDVTAYLVTAGDSTYDLRVNSLGVVKVGSEPYPTGEST